MKKIQLMVILVLLIACNPSESTKQQTSDPVESDPFTEFIESFSVPGTTIPSSYPRSQNIPWESFNSEQMVIRNNGIHLFKMVSEGEYFFLITNKSGDVTDKMIQSYISPVEGSSAGLSWDSVDEYSNGHINDKGIYIIIKDTSNFSYGYGDITLGYTHMSSESYFLVDNEGKMISKPDKGTTSKVEVNYTLESAIQTSAFDLDGLSPEELRIKRNEIFARHGYRFKSADLTEFFSTFDWYKPRYENVDNKLTDADKVTIKYIQQLESNVEDHPIE